MKRRNFLHGLLAALPASVAGFELARAGVPGASQWGSKSKKPGASGLAQRTGTGPAVAIASGNGLKAVEIAYNKLVAGEDPVDAAVAGVNTQELDPKDQSVGYGGRPNFDGVVQLDAAVMHGPSAKGGAVGALEGVKTPSKVAKLVMERTDHVLLVGEGARRFATMHGFPNENLLTEKTRREWAEWRESLSDKDDWVMPAEDDNPQTFLPNGLYHEELRPTGTIHLSALTPGGDLGCCTTTSGLAYKVPGRVGDSPLIGCGLYCDNDIGSAGCTGRGEAVILANAAHLAVELMRDGGPVKDALLDALRRIVHLNRDPLLKRDDGRPNFYVRIYGVNKAGEYAGASIWAGGQFAVCDSNGPRKEDFAYLFEAERP